MARIRKFGVCVTKAIGQPLSSLKNEKSERNKREQAQ